MDETLTSLDPLNGRELEILRLIAGGSSDQEIASQLYLSLNTVKWYNRRIYEKLGVNSRTQAIARASRLIQQPAAVAEAQPPGEHLPAEVNRFIGRRREAAEVAQLLQKNRLVTLVGPPGSGKTRLSLHVARDLAGQFQDGVYFIPLDPVQETGNILWTIAEHLDFQFQALDDSLKELLRFLHGRTALLVLDNFEHLLPGGWLLAEMLKSAPGVKLLVTSRERLTLYGEVVYSLNGMALPETDHWEENAHAEAVELFIERARSVSPGIGWDSDELRSAAHICRLVEGMPLGIELAASWMDTLRPGEIAAEIEHNLDILETELQDTPPSQRSIRAAFDRSWNLLDESHREAFRRLAVFRNGFTREAGEAVAGVGLRHLQSLVNKSLLRRNPRSGRYDIHALLRYYAQEKLEASGEVDTILRAHAAYFADFMAERWPWMKDHRQKAALAEMGADIENARAAWYTSVNAGDVGQIRKFLHGLWAIYDVRGWYPAGIELFEQAVKVMRTAGTQEAEACLGWLLAVQGLFNLPVADYDNALDSGTSRLFIEHGIYSEGVEGSRRGLALAKKGVEILKRLNAVDEMLVVPLISLAIVASHNEDAGGLAVQAAKDCLEVGTHIDDQWGIAKAKQFLAVWAIQEGEYARAESLALEAYRAFDKSCNNWSSSVVCIEVLGLLFITQRKLDTAREWIERGLAAAREIDFKYSMQTGYWQLGYAAALEGNYQEAGKYWHQALKESERMLGGRSFIGFGAAARTKQ